MSTPLLSHVHLLPVRRPSALRSTLLVPVSAALLLVACAQPPVLPPPATPVTPAAAGLVEAPGAQLEPVAPDWWKSLGDARLDALVERALADQPRLQLAAARLQAAQVQSRVAGAAGQVELGLSAEATGQRYSAHGLVPPPIAGHWKTSEDVMLGARWELDFWGRHAAALEAALGAERAARSDIAAARSLLAAEVARAWVALAEAGSQAGLLAEWITQREAVVRVTQARVQGGLDGQAELVLAQARVTELRSQQLAVAERQQLLRHQLAALSAQAPAALNGLAPSLADLKLAPVSGGAPGAAPAASPGPAIGGGVTASTLSTTATPSNPSTTSPPSAARPTTLAPVLGTDLLARRADLVAARQRVEVAAQAVQVARLGYYPDIELSAFAGLSALGVQRLFEVGSRTYGIGPALHLPLFQQRGLDAALGSRAAELDAAVAAYDAAVFDAVRGASDALASRQAVAAQRQRQDEALAQAEEAWRLARRRYDGGLGNLLPVLAAEEQRLAQQRSALALQARAAEAQVQLMHQLGGGWDPAASAAPPVRRPRTPDAASAR